MKFLLPIFTFLLGSCMHQRTEHSKALRQFTMEYEKSLRPLYWFQRMGYGGALMHDIAEVSLTYAVLVDHDVASAREVAMDCIELFTTMINADEKVQPYLHERPFPPERFRLTLSIRNPDCSRYMGKGVSSVVFVHGKFGYFQYDPTTDYSTCLHSETYEEAKRIIDQKNRDTDKPASNPKI